MTTPKLPCLTWKHLSDQNVLECPNDGPTCFEPDIPRSDRREYAISLKFTPGGHVSNELLRIMKFPDLRHKGVDGFHNAIQITNNVTSSFLMHKEDGLPDMA